MLSEIVTLTSKVAQALAQSTSSDTVFRNGSVNSNEVEISPVEKLFMRPRTADDRTEQFRMTSDSSSKSASWLREAP